MAFDDDLIAPFGAKPRGGGAAVVPRRRLIKRQVVSANSTITVPALATSFDGYARGGSGGAGAWYGAGGGGAGQGEFYNAKCNPGETVSVVVGAKGNGGVHVNPPYADGTAGGVSSVTFRTKILAQGFGGGGGSTNGNGAGGAGGGGTGDVVLFGGKGGDYSSGRIGANGSGSFVGGGNGGSTYGSGGGGNAGFDDGSRLNNGGNPGNDYGGYNSDANGYECGGSSGADSQNGATGQTGLVVLSFYLDF